MKKNLLKLMVLMLAIIASIGQMWGQMFKPAGRPNAQTMQSQQILNSGGVYSGTVYEPFSGTTPSEAYNPAQASGRRKVGEGGQEDDFSGFDIMGDTKPSDESPIGEPWIMALFAMIFAGVIAFRQYKRKTIKSMNMKKSTKFIAIVGLLLTLGVGNAWAGYNTAWKGNVFFRAPENWDLTNYSHVQVAVARTTSTNTQTNVAYLGEMTRIGTTRLFYAWIDNSHNGWNQTEYVVFTANSSTYGQGDMRVDHNHHYTTPVNYDFTSADNPYLYNPSGEDDGASVSGSYSSTGADYAAKRDNLLKKTQRVDIYTNGSSSKAGGSVRIDGTYLTSNTESATSYETNGSETYVTYGNVIGTPVTLTAAAEDGYHFVGWFESASGGSAVSTNTSYSYTCTGAKTLYARFEAMHDVTVNAGANGSTTPSSGNTITAGYYTEAEASASANAGYYFTGWTLPGSGVTVASGYNTSSNPIHINATAGSKAITANFAPKWRIIGGDSGDDDGDDAMGDWSETANQITTDLDANSGSTQITLNANTTYYFKVLDKSATAYYSVDGSTMDYSASDVAWQLYTGKSNSTIATAGAGTYTFAWDNANQKLTVTYPTSYTVTFGYGTGGTAISATVEDATTLASSGLYAAKDKDITFAQTPHAGYTFAGWFDAESGGNAIACMSGDNVYEDIDGNISVYAQYTPNPYKVTFNATTNGGTITTPGSIDGSNQITVTYDAVPGGTMPTATKNAHYFKGWYTASSGGNLVISTAGEWQANVSGYTGEGGKWVGTSAQTLYAQYGVPAFSGISFSSENVLPVDSVSVTPTFDYNPEGTYTLCYRLMCHKPAGNFAMEDQPEFKQEEGYTVSFTAPGEAAEYTVEVRLFVGSNNCGSTEGYLSIYNDVDDHLFTVEPTHSVTIQYKSGSAEVRPSTSVLTSCSQAAASVTAPDIPGMSFVEWDYSGVSFTDGTSYTDQTVKIHACSENGTLTAKYSQASFYFKKPADWEGVYVYFYRASNYWTDGTTNNTGTGSSSTWNYGGTYPFDSGPHELTLLDGTDDVYYYPENLSKTASVMAFTATSMPNYNYFTGKIVRVTSFDANNPMIVPTGNGTKRNDNTATYYDYDKVPVLQDWGWTIKFDCAGTTTTHKLIAEKMGDLVFKTKVYVEKYNYNYQWNVTNSSSTAYGKADYPAVKCKGAGNNNPMTGLTSGVTNMLLLTNAPGEYIFTVTYGTSTTYLANNMSVEVTYPLSVGDYRLIYKDDDHATHPSNIIRKANNGSDIVSMYYDPTVAKHPVLSIQTCSDIEVDHSKGDNDPSIISWGSTSVIDLSSFSSVLTESGVYNFTVEQDANGANPAVTNVEKYTGRFYVRTDCVNSDKWNYKESKDAHAMTYSAYSTTLTSPDKPFSHYFVKDLHGKGDSTINIRFTVATDYSDAITDTVINGVSSSSDPYYDYYGDEALNRTANVRFTYNQASNKIWRAYTEGPEFANYMQLESKAGLYTNKDDVSPTLIHKFADQGNWVYQIDVYVDAGSYVKLTACMHDHSNTSHTQYLKGIQGDGGFDDDDAVKLLDGTAKKQHMRIMYDFKTDRMTTAWIPGIDPITGTAAVHADIMLIRQNQDGAQSIIFSTGEDGKPHQLTYVETAYGVMQIDSSFVNNVSKSRYSRSLYWISFPFDVKVSEIFGFGTFNKHWAIEYYDGKGRAKGGYWVDSDPNWKFVTSSMRDTFVLKANEGYVLALNLSRMADGCTDVWPKDVNTAYLYFPSADQIGTITNVATKHVRIDTVGYQCKINRGTASGNRTIKDSHWHCIGVPSFAENTLSGTATSEPANWTTEIPYVYEWNSVNNSLSVNKSGSYLFKAMHSYLVQFSGDTITWTNVSNIPPASIARRKITGREADYHEWNLNLLRNNEHIDHTYVRMTNDENATEGFDFGNDLSKEMNEGSNIYTFVGEEWVAGNVMPINNQTVVVPVGVRIDESGEYTFSMPEGTNGTGVVLIDNIAGTRTNLGLTDYSVTLTAGTHDGRFTLEIPAITQTPTDIELTSADVVDGVRKVMVDGVLYIVKDGQVFDARGNRIQ